MLVSLENVAISVVVTSSVHDLTDIHIVEFHWQFTTSPLFNLLTPTVVSQRPAKGTAGVASTSSIIEFLNEQVITSTLPGAVHVTANEVQLPSTVQVTDHGQTVEFPPYALIRVFLDTLPKVLPARFLWACTRLRSGLRPIPPPQPPLW